MPMAHCACIGPCTSPSHDDSRDQILLRDAYDAYLVFCENGSHQIAWRSLSVTLNLYLMTKYLVSSDGIITYIFGPHPNPSRVEYLAGLDFVQLGYLTEDVLWVLFWNAGLVCPDHDIYSELENFQKIGLVETDNPTYKELQDTGKRRQLVRSHFHTLQEHELQLLIVDIANELNRRKWWRVMLTPLWDPRLGTDTGILAHISIRVDGVTEQLIEKFGEPPKELDQGETATALTELPKMLLRRALSVGAGGSRKRPSRTRPSRDKILSRLLPLNEIGQVRHDAPSVTDGSSDNMFADSLRSTNRVLPGAGSRASLSEASTSRATVFPTSLNTILEVTTENESDVAKFDGETLYTDSDSVSSAESFDAVVDFYNLRSPSSSASGTELLDQSKRASIDFGEMGRSEKLQQLLRSRRQTDDGSSFVSQTAPSSHSSFSANHSFVTAETHLSARTTGNATNRTSTATFLSIQTANSHDGKALGQTAYWNMLKERDLLPEPELENDWSGRGQHVEFAKTERDQVPLEVEKLLGETRNARVESVRCRRVRLVRKMMRCNKWSGLKREDALQEVQHLYRVQHSHIVRLVGTYVIGLELAILTYPCAEWNLEQFMAHTRSGEDMEIECASLRRFFTCLAKVLAFMHSYPLKHMDIKPQNLLVRDIRNSTINGADSFKIYVTDFGISRSYETIEDCETDNPTSFTRTYAAKEVVLQESRNLSADLFSLGCVFAEMLATILDASNAAQGAAEESPPTYWKALDDARRSTSLELRPYYSTNTKVCAYLAELPLHEPELDMVRIHTMTMLDSDPCNRPTARQISNDPRLPFACLSCTLHTDPEAFEAAKPLAPPPVPPEFTHL